MPHTIIGIQYPENMYLNINTEINKYCEEETEKELSWQNIVDYFPPKFIRWYMKVKMKIKKRYSGMVSVFLRLINLKLK